MEKKTIVILITFVIVSIFCSGCINQPLEQTHLTPEPIQLVDNHNSDNSNISLLSCESINYVHTDESNVNEVPKEISIDNISIMYGDKKTNIRTITDLKITNSYWITGAIHDYYVGYKVTSNATLFFDYVKFRIEDKVKYLKFDSDSQDIFYVSDYTIVKRIDSLPINSGYEVVYEVARIKYREILVDEWTFNEWF